MKNKMLYIAIGIMFIGFSGCSKSDNNSSVIPVISESLKEIEMTVESEGQSLDREQNSNQEIEGANGTSGDIELPGEIVEGSTLTKEEIEELVASSQEKYKEGLEAYQEITETGQWVVPGQGGQAIITEVVGKPGDTSWKQMTDEEARAFMEEKPGSAIGEGELNAGTWNRVFGGKLYFNPYEYQEALRAANDARVGFTDADFVD